MIPAWLFHFFRFSKIDEKIDNNNTCACSKIFTYDNKPIMCDQCLNVRCHSCWVSCWDLNDINNTNTLQCRHCLSKNICLKIVPYILLNNNEQNDVRNECVICTKELTNDDPVLSCGHSICYEDFKKWYFKDNNSKMEFEQNQSSQLIYLRKPIKCIICQQSILHVALYGFQLPQKASAIELWDLRFLYLYMQQQNTIEESNLVQAITEYRNFIFAKKQSHDSDGLIFSPCWAVDMVWHSHILFTENYREFCDKAIGFFIHHRPHGKFETKEKDERFKRTINWFYDNNISFDTNIWLSMHLKLNEKTLNEKTSNEKTQNLNKIVICVKLQTQTKYYRMENDDRIWNIKSMLYHDLGYAPGDQRIIFGGKDLGNNVKILDILIDHSNEIINIITFHMILRFRGC